jgi:hypothetical protein
MLKIADQTLPFQLQMTAIPMKIQSVHFQLTSLDLPENLFTENEDEMKSFAVDTSNVDTSLNINYEACFSLNI